jgi:uncharacterized protein (DUF58 family)
MRLPFTITRAGFSYLFVMSFVLAVAMLREINLLYMVAGLMAGPLMLNALLATFMPRRISVRRSFPPAVTAGETITVHLAATNHRRRMAAWIVVVEDTLARVRNHQPQRRVCPTAWLPLVKAQTTQHTQYHGRIELRGRYRFGPLRLVSRFPLGLFARTITLSNTNTQSPANGARAADANVHEELFVYPRIGRLTALGRSIWGGVPHGTLHTRRKGRAENEFHGLRDWQRGDSRRMIHWRSTAKRGDIVVREFEDAAQQDLGIVLDLGRNAASVSRNGAVIERGVQVAATLVAETTQRTGVRILLALVGERVTLLDDTASTRTRERMLAALAEVEPAQLGDGAAIAQQDARLEAMVRSVRETLRSGAPVVVIRARQMAADDADVDDENGNEQPMVVQHATAAPPLPPGPNVVATGGRLWQIDVAAGADRALVEFDEAAMLAQSQ